jgi:hypothetical protein
MKQGLALPEFAAEVRRQADAKADYVADTRRMLFGVYDGGEQEEAQYPYSPGTATLFIDDAADDGVGAEFALTSHAHGQISDRLGIPKRYYDRLLGEAPSLLSENVGYWFTHRPERRLVRTLDGRARAFLSDRYRRLDNFDLAERIMPVLGDMPDVRFESLALTDTRLYIKAVLPGVQGEVKVGDVVCSGVVVSNSEVGSGALSVETLLYRLSCLNGAISGVALRKHHAGGRIGEEDDSVRIFRDETMRADDEAFWLKVEDLVRAACSEASFQAIVAHARDRASEALGEAVRMRGPVEAVERLANRATLTDDVQQSVLTHLIEGGDLTLWGLANAVTRASQDVGDYDLATDLERLGGRIIVEGAAVLS